MPCEGCGKMSICIAIERVKLSYESVRRYFKISLSQYVWIPHMWVSYVMREWSYES